MSGNRLSQETSPYLLQHQDNPVHWWPWGTEALGEAQANARPILLSIGYAACHWCHVMARESFGNVAIADVMNQHFVNIKVDREERPEIDAIYMQALHHLGEQGGWPLTMFLTPTGLPFWGGTYFPPEPRYGRPGFGQILLEVSRIFREEPQKIETNAHALRTALRHQPETVSGDPGPALPIEAATQLLPLMDPVHGGIKGAPKFPQVPLLSLLWRAFLRSGRTDFRTAVTRALDHLCEGGIYDHLGGGFARYCVDAEWHTPHFEKMLYDNAQLISLLTTVWQTTRDPRYATRIEETVNWVLREMVTEEGAFAASLDADSDGQEGRFYVWSRAEIEAVAGQEAAFFCEIHNVSSNQEEVHILNRLDQADRPFDRQVHRRLHVPRQRLLEARNRRTPPARDDKVLLNWNALMITALADASVALGRTDWLEAARTAFDFLERTLIVDGRTFHTYRAGRTGSRAVADDLANLARAALALHDATADPLCLNHAERALAELETHYLDDNTGSFFLTADDAEALIIRIRDANDEATPAANGTLPETLTRLHALTGKPAFLARADSCLQAFATQARRNVFSMGSCMVSLDTRMHLVQIILLGSADETRPLLDIVRRFPPPATQILRLDNTGDLPPDHPAAGKTRIKNRATAYCCTGSTCSPPVTTPEELRLCLEKTVTPA